MKKKQNEIQNKAAIGQHWHPQKCVLKHHKTGGFNFTNL